MIELDATAFAVVVTGAFLTLAYRRTRRKQAALSKRRANMTQEQFRAAMLPHVSEGATRFLWDTALVYLKPDFTPHPDDDLVQDLWIDGDDWSMDWPRDFAESQGFSEKAFPDWPRDRAVTILNFGRWLDAGQAAATANVAAPGPPFSDTPPYQS